MSTHHLDPSELRTQEAEDLTRQLNDFKQELFNLRFQHHTGQLENFRRITHVKRNIARINTILREREIAGSSSQAQAPSQEN